ncbi:unnamed protein product [Paramecium primaurelia]|uniref:Protein kinase domain-containing protein n=1 Tax=Paramecium primaurelia TaxID=5886 RepID=A0A8S1KX51_PARPR|nr:unnamed protein product [Paramecium primaurelia]
MDFYYNYSIIEQRYANQFGIQNNVSRIEANFSQQNYTQLVSIGIPKYNIDERNLYRYRILKYLNVLQPEQYCCTQDEHFLIYQNLYQHLLNEQKLKNIIQQEGFKILLQLVLIFAEFQRRKFYWPLNSINQIYFIDGIIYISLLEYDFTKFNQPLNYLDNFWKFFTQYFIHEYQFQEMAYLMNQQNFDQILEYLFIKNGNIHQQSGLNPKYEKVLQYLLKIDKFNSLYQGNCVVKEFKKNEVFSIYPNLTNDIVYKSTEIKGNEDSQKTILQQIQRDIELMELFSYNENVATCFAYIRIQQYAFLLFRKFFGTLANRFETWPKRDQTEEQIRKDVYVITSRTADSLKILHEKQVIHRDLKPENVFIDNENLSDSFSYIADFDCSKQIQGQINVTLTNVDSSYTQNYDPPETYQSFKYDIFQLGLIFLTIANKGKYIGDYKRGPRLLQDHEFVKYYSLEAIQRSLQSTNYDINFINIIAQCLHRDPNRRPDIGTICNLLGQFKKNVQIKIIRKSIIQQQDQTNEQQQSIQTNDQNQKSNHQIQRSNTITIMQNSTNNQAFQEQSLTPTNYQQQQKIQINYQNPVDLNSPQQINNLQQSQFQQLQQSQSTRNLYQTSNNKIKFWLNN